jgi:predicted metal-dependent phosphoesterase TrpH
VARGFARDTQQAFDRWLNRNTPGHVPAEWPSFDDAMAVLRDSGAIAVLAHPHRYRLSAGSCANSPRHSCKPAARRSRPAWRA